MSMPKVTPDQVKDTAILAGLVLLVAAALTDQRLLLWPAGLCLLLALLKPGLFKPLAWLWFGLSHLLGRLMTTLLLTGLFFLVVTPVGVLRRWLGHDPMRIRAANRQGDSAFSQRQHQFTPADLERPF